MTPNDNSDASINVWCDWLTDNGQEQFADETRFEQYFSAHLFYHLFISYEEIDIYLPGDGFVSEMGNHVGAIDDDVGNWRCDWPGDGFFNGPGDIVTMD